MFSLPAITAVLAIWLLLGLVNVISASLLIHGARKVFVDCLSTSALPSYTLDRKLYWKFSREGSPSCLNLNEKFGDFIDNINTQYQGRAGLLVPQMIVSCIGLAWTLVIIIKISSIDSTVIMNHNSNITPMFFLLIL